ncbi:MAG: glycosyltransferase family 4 protein [Rubrivivax sp.]|nr:glycosyltransferase family 4 protein [Rubrivivax sp.]
MNPAARKAPVFVIISQVYVPDPAAVGQYFADLAAEMVRRGYKVVVLTARHGYEDSSRVYPSTEVRDGVHIRRLPLSSFGKDSIKMRLLAQISFLLQAMFHSLFTPRLCGLMVSTSPPACGIGGAIVSLLRRVPVKFWVMDLNPDQLVVMKVLPAKAWPVRLFDAFNQAILRRASDIVALDRFMADRIAAKAPVARKITLLPLWPHDERVINLPHAGNPFRAQHVPQGRFVLMYSGLHTAANPLSTLLDAVERLQDEEPRLLLMCIGGGSAKKDVEERIARGARNIVSLPYQPRETLQQSLSAADVHLVSMGDDMVGIVHPCKIYGAMGVSRPILALGPRNSHIGDLVHQHQAGWHVAHGDVDGAVEALRNMLLTDAATLQAMGQRAGAALTHQLSRPRLLGQVCDVMQRGLPSTRPSATAGRPAFGVSKL